MNFLKVGWIAGVLLLSSLPSLGANQLFRNFPISDNPKEVYQKKSTTVGGSRFYCENPLGQKNMELVVPDENVVHLTASTTPSFYYFSEGAASEPLIFTLVALDQAEPLVEETLIISEAGYHKITLPTQIKLEPGKTYIWNIAIPCSNDPENFREILRAAVQYIPPSPELLEKIQNANSQGEKIQIFTEEIMWYDFVNLLNLNKLEVQADLQN